MTGPAIWNRSVQSRIVQHREYAPIVYYTLANGYYEFFRIRRTKDPYYIYLKETELNHAKELYMKTLDYTNQNNIQISKTYVNLGNCYDHLGRVVDALECYEEALKLNPYNGMALGNKGMAMYHYGWLAGQHQATFLIEAYSYLSRAMKSEISQEAGNTFLKCRDKIRGRFSNKGVLDNPPKYPGYLINVDADFERFLIEFCMTNKLYLNICNFCQKCDAAIGDTAIIQKMRVQLNKDQDFVKDNPYYHLAAYLNQIKQDYVTSRFLLIMSRYKGLDLSFVDKRVKIINTLDYSIHNVYVQLVKHSFKNFCDILDKIACCINNYLKLGISEKEVNFRRIWYHDPRTRKIHRGIINIKNLSLNALYDIYRDFEIGQYKGLRNTRNALTHRFVNIRMLQALENDENMTETRFVEQTIKLSKIVRNVIVYLLHFVYIEERKKEKEGGEIVPSVFADEINDNLKHNR